MMALEQKKYMLKNFQFRTYGEGCMAVLRQQRHASFTNSYLLARRF
jgi:hypothetical protein